MYGGSHIANSRCTDPRGTIGRSEAPTDADNPYDVILFEMRLNHSRR